MCPTVAQSRPDSAEFDSINVNVMPIVLLPGVMGTRIQLGGPHWDPDSPTELGKMVFLRQRSLANLLDSRKKGVVFNSFAAGPAQEIESNPALVDRAQFLTGKRTADSAIFYGTQRGWGGVAWNFYGEFLMKLEERFIALGNYPVYAIGYDWRQSCRVSGGAVLQRLRAILQQEGATKALIVTHSMGGLVLRAALQQGATPLVQGVVHCVMPALGAVVAYRRFHTGATDLLDGQDPTGAATVTSFVAARILDRILGLTPLEYTLTQAYLPGPVELLPTDDYPDIFIRFPLDGAPPPALVLEANTAAPNSLVSPPMADIYSLYLQAQQPGILPSAGDTDPPTVIPVMVGPTPVLVSLPGETITSADVSSLSNNIVNARAFQASVRNLVHPKSAFLVGDIINTDTQVDFTRSGGGPAGTRISPPRGPDGAGGASSTDPNDPASSEGAGAGPPSSKITVTASMAVRRPAGDGTVPFSSARFASAGGSNIFRRSFPVKHADCFKDPGFRKEVKQQLLKFAGLPPDQPDKDDL
jgi:hypothetical protein